MPDEKSLCSEIIRLFDSIPFKEIDKHLAKTITAYSEGDPPEDFDELMGDINKQIIIVNFFHRLSFRYEIWRKRKSVSIGNLGSGKPV